MVATEAKDILDVIAPHRLKQQQEQAPLSLGGSPEEDCILQLIQQGVRDGDQLQQLSKLSPADFATALTMLEVNGVIKPLGANRWALK